MRELNVSNRKSHLLLKMQKGNLGLGSLRGMLYNLLSKIKVGQISPVSFDVSALEIVEQFFPFSNQLHQTLLR
jgi:hypothetical protein